MKKEYKKPVIIFESFALAKSIAVGCDQIATSAQYVCPVTDPDLGFTYISIGTCDTTPPGGNDSICYHAPTESTNVFNS